MCAGHLLGGSVLTNPLILDLMYEVILDQVFSFFIYGPLSTKRTVHENKEGKNEDP